MAILSIEEWNNKGLSLKELMRLGTPKLEYYDLSKAKKINFREAQQKAYDECKESHKKGLKNLVISLSTGGGKTLFAYEYSRRELEKNPNQIILFCVNRDALVKNAQQAFEKELNAKVGIIQADKPMNLERQIQIVSLQTLNNRLDKENIANVFLNLPVEILWQDEAHYDEIAANKFIEMFKGDIYRFGLTATAFPVHLSRNYDHMIKPFYMRDLINQEVLVDYKLLCMVEQGIQTKELEKDKTGEYEENSINKALSKLLVIGNPAKDWYDNPETYNKYTIVFCPNKVACDAMYDHFMDSGYLPQDEIGVMHSGYTRKHNEDILIKCKQGQIRVIISVNMLREGVDLPHFSHGIDFQPLAENKYIPDEPKSLTTYIQKYGRILRSFAGANKVLMTDGTVRLFSFDDTPEGVDIIEVIPKKEYAVIRDYTEINRFASPIDIDSRYSELIEGNEEKEDLKEKEEQTLNDIENDNAEALLPPKIICPSCHQEIEQPPFCGHCGEKIERVESYIAPSVEIEFKDGYCVVARVPDNIQIKLDKREQERIKEANKVKRVDYNNLTREQAVNVMTAAMIKIDHMDKTYKKGVSLEKRKKMFPAMCRNVIKDQYPINSKLKKEAYENFLKVQSGDYRLARELNKYVSKVEREQKKYWSKKT